MFVCFFQEVTYILCNCIRSVAEILKELTSVMSDSVSFEIDIRRTHVLEDSMREAKKAKFSTLKRIQVVFLILKKNTIFA